MEKREFNFILNLIEDGDVHSAAYLMKENAPSSFELLLKEIHQSSDSPFEMQYRDFYLDTLNGFSPKLISSYLQKDFVSVETVFLHANAFLFDLNFIDISCQFESFISRIMKDLDKAKIHDLDPLEAIQTLHNSISTKFIIDSHSDHVSNIQYTIQHQGISQYSLGIIYLIVAERLGIPIFGLPFEDKLSLMYTKAYCDHNESVYPEDILHYFIVGEVDIVYTPLDLELMAIMNDETLSLSQKLPQNSSQIIKKWINHVIQQIHEPQRKNRLSIKYQQIAEHITEFESF